MGVGRPVAATALLLLAAAVTALDEDRWSRPATAERRQGDWVPLTCANCRPVVDQGAQSSNSLPSVLTPPPRVEEARLLPPPPPPDGLFQTAATGFLQQYTQQQPPLPPRKPLQFLQETSSSINRPQAQFLKQNIPQNQNHQQGILQEPSSDFQPPQQPQIGLQQSNRQPQLINFNQQLLPEQPYLNQPIFLPPQFVAAPFFPQPNIPPQNIQTINSAQVQQQSPLSPNVLPANNQNFQIPADRPVFTQQITAGSPEPPLVPHQAVGQPLAPQDQYSFNGTDNQNEGEGEEVQLLYVPVETLNQRARNLGKQKSLPSNQGIAAQTVGTESNTFTSPGQNFAFPTRKPHFEDQTNFNTQLHSSKHQHIKQQFQQRPPPEDQEKFNSQIHTVREQFNVNQGDKFLQQPLLKNQENFRLEAQNTKQFNPKPNNQFQSQFQQEQSFNLQHNVQHNTQQHNLQHNAQQQNVQHNAQQQNVQHNAQQHNVQHNAQQHNVQQHNVQQHAQFQQIPNEDVQNFRPQQLEVNQHPINHQDQFNQNNQQDQVNFNVQSLDGNQQFSTQLHENNFQQLPVQQQQHESIKAKDQPRQQFNQQIVNQNQQFHQQNLQLNQQTLSPEKRQPYLNQPIHLSPAQPQLQPQLQQQFSTQQTQIQQQFDQPEIQTVAPVTQTRQSNIHVTEPAVTHARQPSTYATQQAKTQRFRNPQHAPKVTQQLQDQQFRRFPEDYHKQTEDSTNVPQVSTIDARTQTNGLRQNQQQFWSNQNEPTHKPEQESSKYQLDHHSVSSVAPPVTTLPTLQTTLAPNQPPLSVYMETTEDTKVNDVLRLLKNAKSIQVLDTIGPESPQVFVGPSNLNAPDGYIKFELPYLNSLDSNRVERKVDKLPFFVAPLNFNPPPGYSKIPFPAPHIGSVVVSNDTVLRTALHEKPFFHEPAPPSASEKYLDQYTLPAQIAPISPQLPSLINSLQDEIFSGSSTPTYSTTPEPTTTTTAYSTTSYRSRGSSRGSQRGTSSYTTPASQSRRSQSRTRRPYDGRPYSRRQPVTTPTTTLEPSTEAPIAQYPQHEQVSFNSEDYSVQNTASPFLTQIVNKPAKLQPDNEGSYYSDRFVSSGLNENQFSSQQQIGEAIGNQNIQEEAHINNNPNIQQYQQPQSQSEAQPQNQYNSQVPVHTSPHPIPSPTPTVAAAEVQSEDQSFRSQRPSGSRRDSLRQHQRFRGRQRLTTTTTTENYDEPVEPTQDRFNQQTSSGITYQNVPNRHHLRNHDQSRLVENVHFQANVPQHNIQTERADVGVETTEKVFPVQNEQRFIQQTVENTQFKSQINNQFQVPTVSQSEEPIVNQANLRHQFQQSQAQFSQPSPNTQQSNAKAISQGGFDYIPATQQNTKYTNDNFQQGQFAQQPQNLREHQPQLNHENVDQVHPEGQLANPVAQLYFDQLQQQDQKEAQPVNHAVTETLDQHPFSNVQTISSQQDDGEGIQRHNQNIQAIQVQTSDQFAQHVTELSPTSPQEIPVQTQVPETSQAQLDDSQVQQYNQQRLKYNRPHNRFQAATVSSPTGEQTSSRRGQYNFQSIENNAHTTTEPATTKASLVRVRGRVRSRQRASTRVTSTEAPNYPTTYLNRQRNNAEKEETQEYVPKKRVNYNRQTFSSLRPSINKEEDNEQSFTEPNYVSTDRQSTSERFSDYAEVTTTTTTEAAINKPSRRYQHILNRNKLRRVRPTNAPSTSGSTGTTKFLLPTTSPPITRLPLSRGRIRKPVNIKTTTTTEYPQVNNNWNEKDNFAPSAGSNEILEPLYQTRDKPQQTFGFQRAPVVPQIPQKSTPKPLAPVANEDEDDYWNQAVTIQQSTSFDFKPEHASVTPPSFQENRAQGTFSPIWNGQIELQDGNYYDIFNQQQIAKNAQDQTPFSSDHQKVVYKDIKTRIPVGKENQYTEKTYDVHKQTVPEEEENVQNERVYPVYREITKPAETLQEETSQIVADLYEGEGKGYVHEKDADDLSENSDLGKNSYEETASLEPEREIKEGALKRKIIASHPGKKGGHRRGSWVRVRVRKPQDMFETAESQNLASLSENAIQAVTKTVGEKAAWTPEPEPVTELPQITTTSEANEEPEAKEEPVETINFEDALKDMLKEFITNPDEENKEEESDGSVSNTNVTTGEPAEYNQNDDSSQVKSEDLDKATVNNEEVQDEDEQKSVLEEQSENKKEEEHVKTVFSEVTTEGFTQEPTTIIQMVENAETTIEPESTTTPNEPTFKTRVLGTSTTTEISLETEICYRGRCVKTKKGEPDGDLLTME